MGQISNLPAGFTLHDGKYKIIRYISKGGFGCTYEAEYVHEYFGGQKVAIKEFFMSDFCNRDDETAHVTISTQSKRDLVDKLRKKFIDEALAIHQLNHPGIVKVSDVFEENGTAYYVMQYIQGRSLHDMVKADGAMSEARALHYIRRVADALKYVHSNNRLHLDIKPGNIMVGPDDNAVLIDFGASKQYDEEGGENTSTLMGKTPGYAPPEQMGNNVAKFMPASDIYALGATLYKLVTGKTPPASTLLACGETLDPMPDTVSQPTQRAILCSMVVNRAARPQSIDEFLAILDDKSKPAVPEAPKPIEADDESTVVNFDSTPSKPEVVSEPKPEPKPEPKKETKPEPKQEAKPEPKPEPKKEKKEPQKKETAKEAKKPEPAKPEKPKASEDKKPIESGKSKKPIIFGGIGAIAVIAIVLGIVFAGGGGNDVVTEPEEEAEETVQNLIEVNDMPYTNSRGINFVYTGTCTPDSVPNGKGTGIYSGAFTYIGEYKDGLRHGECMTTEPEGKFKGKYEKDLQREGEAIHIDGNGKIDQIYIGTFDENQDPLNGIYYDENKNEIAKCVNGVIEITE